MYGVQYAKSRRLSLGSDPAVIFLLWGVLQASASGVSPSCTLSSPNLALCYSTVGSDNSIVKPVLSSALV
jgi:hypothetical protein